MSIYKFSKAIPGAIVDDKGEQYLPTMDESYATLNIVSNGVVGIQKLGDYKIISSDTTSFFIRNAYTLEVLQTITAPRTIRYTATDDGSKPFAISNELNKIYCITSNVTDVVYLSIYNISLGTWEDHLLSGYTSTYANSVSRIIVDEIDNAVFLYTTQYAKMYKFSLTTFELLIQGTIGSQGSRISFDGTFLYAMVTTSNHSQIKKYDKSTFTILASTSDTYYRSTSTVTSGEVFLYGGYLFVSSMISGIAYNIAKVRVSDFVIVAYTGDSIIESSTMCADDGRLFGVHGGATSGLMEEFDINTLASKDLNIVTTGSYNDQVLIMPKSGVIFGGTTAALAQIERTYTVGNYKNVKEIV